jgi:GT2 family glycosyltransferase
MNARTGLPPASLLICSRDRPQLLIETVHSVLAGQELPQEIVIVDQSVCKNAELADFPQRGNCCIRYILSRTTGLSRARNEAITAARYDLLVIIDDDMFVERDWFGALVRALVQAPPRTVVTGKVLPLSGRAGGFVPALVTSDEPATYAGRLNGDVLAGGHMAAFRSAFIEVGGFDERLGAGSRFPAADDNDLGLRLLESGYTLQYIPQAVVHHRAWRPGSEYLPMRWRYGRGKGGFYGKYLRGHAPLRTHMGSRLLRDLGRRARGFPGRLVRDPRGAAGDVIYSAGVLSGVLQWLLTR